MNNFNYNQTEDSYLQHNGYLNNMPSSMCQNMSIMSQCKFYHYTPDDDNFYYVTCKIILQDAVSDDRYYDYKYDHRFFYQHHSTGINYHVTCKVLPHFLILKLLNRIDFDINNLEHISLSLSQ